MVARRFAGAGLLRRQARSSSGGGGAAPLALDSLSATPAGWWNVARRDRTAYTGPLCLVERTSPSAELAIGYVAGTNLLDTAAIASFCSGTTGRVKTLYDQSGNGRDVTQATHANQPIIYTGGALVTLGTLPGMDFDGVSDYLSRADACGLTGASAVTAVYVGDADTATGAQSALYFGDTSRDAATGCFFAMSPLASASMRSNTRLSNTDFGSGITAGAILLPHYAISQLAASGQFGTVTCEVNGTAATETAEVNPTNTLALTNESTLIGALQGTGASPSAAFFFDGRITASGIWSSVLSAGDLSIVRAACARLIV